MLTAQAAQMLNTINTWHYAVGDCVRILAVYKTMNENVHRVVIDNEASDFLPVTSGIPQGSILGPHLFLVYMM